MQEKKLFSVANICFLVFIFFPSVLWASINGSCVMQAEDLHSYRHEKFILYYPQSGGFERDCIDDDLGLWDPLYGFVTQCGERIDGYLEDTDFDGSRIIASLTGSISDNNEVSLTITFPARNYYYPTYYETIYYLHTKEVISLEGLYDRTNGVIEGTFNEHSHRCYQEWWTYDSSWQLEQHASMDVTGISSNGTFEIYVNLAPEATFLDAKDSSLKVIGAAADGATKVVIQIASLPENITLDDIQISIPEGDVDGHLEGDKEISNGVFTQTYVVPVCFVRDGHPEDLTAQEREIGLNITVMGEQIDYEPFNLIRPPVVMVHGLWGNGGDFADLDTELYNNGFTYLYRPSYNNSAFFTTNYWVLPYLIRNVFKQVQTGGYACTKVDIVAHSMGGLLAKRLDPAFAHENVRKIITIGSPYQGSPLADILWAAITDDPFRTFFLEENLNDLFHTTKSITGGAIKDLRCYNNPNIPVSTKIQDVDCRNVIVGLRDGAFWDIPLDFYVTGLMLMTRQWTPEAAHDFIFGPAVNSDWVVSEGSQQYDADMYQVIPVHWHCSEPQDTDFKDIVIEALNQPAQTSKSTFSSLVAEELYVTLSHKSTRIGKGVYSLSSEPNGTVDIIEPNEGQVCTVGQNITIALQGTGDTTHAAVFAFFGTFSWADIVQLPWTGDVNIPLDSVGSAAKISVIGLDPNMNMTGTDRVDLVLDSNIVLTEIFFGFGGTWYFDFKTDPCQPHELQLYPMGKFSDGSEHPLSILAEPTTYESLNEYVATVDSNGLVTVHRQGSAAIVVRNSSKIATVVVEVDTYSGDLNLDGIVNFLDFSVFAGHWLNNECTIYDQCNGADLDNNGDVGLDDFAEVAENWLQCGNQFDPDCVP